MGIKWTCLVFVVGIWLWSACNFDTDGDGVCDTDDPCVDVPDSDGDGICDDVDD